MMLWYVYFVSYIAYIVFSHVFSLFRLVHSLDLTVMQALPEDLKTKLSIDDELVSSPKEAFSRVSADRRNKLMKRFHTNILVLSLNSCSWKVEYLELWNLNKVS